MKTSKHTNNANRSSHRDDGDLKRKRGKFLDKTKKSDQSEYQDLWEAINNIQKLKTQIEDSIKKLERIYSDLDRIEQNAEKEFDKLILRQVKDLVEE